MKIKLVVLLVLTAAVATTGGSATPVTGAVAAPRRPAAVGRYSTPESAVPLTPQQEYVTTVRGLAAAAGYAEQTAAEYIQGGRDICAQFDAGDTWTDFRAFVTEYGLDYNIHRAYAWAAVRTFCPEQTAALR